jgi:hypothetical protein
LPRLGQDVIGILTDRFGPELESEPDHVLKRDSACRYVLAPVEEAPLFQGSCADMKMRRGRAHAARMPVIDDDLVSV